MRSFTDAKAMARTLREAMTTRGVTLSHSECLELVAQQFGLPDWNVLAAKIDASSTQAARREDIRLIEAIPILRIFSEDKAREFYIDFLGFNLDWEHRFGENFPLYAQVSRANIKLHLSEHHGDASPGSTVFVWMRGIANYHRELLAKNYKYNRPGLEEAAWDALSMQVSDPFGNKLRFSEPNQPDDPRAQ
jgi:catechol 2,3-dioxygenase-like lactoylglutathione lyase family enzyme